MEIDHPFLDDPEGAYQAAVDEVPALSREEQTRCLQHIRAKGQHADSAVQRLVEANLHLVMSIAARYHSKGIYIRDLTQRGNEGLLSAAHTFSDNPRDDFPAHAIPYIERAIAEAIPH